MAELSRVLVQLKEDCPLPIALDDFAARRRCRPSRSPRSSPSTASPACSSGSTAARAAPSAPTQLNPAKPDTAGAPASPAGQPPAAARDARRSTATAYECVPVARAARRTGSRAPSPRGWWRSTPRPAASTRCAPSSPGSAWRSGPNDACYIPLGHGGSDMFAEKPVQVDRPGRATTRCKPLLESDAVLKVGQNIKYDINILARCADIAVAPIDDTMIISFDARRRPQRSKGSAAGTAWTSSAERHLGHTTLTFKDICGSGQEGDPVRRSAARPGDRSTPPRTPTSPGGCTRCSSRASPTKAAPASTSGSTGR